MGVHRGALILAGLAVGVASPATALADKRITAGSGNRFTTPDVTMDQGERLTFLNLDPLVRHNVWSSKNGPDGKPLFKTPTIGYREEAFVEGSQYITTGDYEFVCTLHAGMTGMLHVTSNGTPATRPVPGTTVDTTAPQVSVKFVSARQAAVRRSNTLRVSVTVDEAATVALKATARIRGKTVAIARGTDRTSAGGGTSRAKLKLTAAGRKALNGKRSVRVTVKASAVDTAGNRAAAKASRTLRR